MAQLQGVKIRGTNNYKGLMTIGTNITEGLTTTLKAVGDGMGGYSPLQLSTKEIGANKTVALSAGATNEQLFNLSYTINNSGAQTGSFTGILMNATTGAGDVGLNGMGHNLMDLRVNGASRFLINSSGGFTALSGYHYGLGFIIQGSQSLIKLEYFLGGAVRIKTSGEGKMLLSGDNPTMFDMIQFGGTTNAYPALKRNGAALNLVLADDSGYANLLAGAGEFIGYSTGVQRLRFNNGSINGNHGLLRSESTSYITLRAANETDFAFFRAKLRTAEAFVASVPTPTGYLTMYGDDGTAYKISATPL